MLACYGARRAFHSFSSIRTCLTSTTLKGCAGIPRTRSRRRGYATESVAGVGLTPIDNIRNIAIIAHVDHGKTTLVDQLLRQSGTIKRLLDIKALQFTPTSSSLGTTADPQVENGFITRVMDSNALERERGITILSKCTSIQYKGTQINIVDTPGHADFGGEVERVLSMVDGVALVVDATEGPMTQTRFVLGKALARGLKPLVVLNKADRPTSRPAQVESDLFDLFATLGATDEQMDYPLLYASAKQGWAQAEMPKIAATDSTSDPGFTSSASADEGEVVSTKMTPLFDLILSHIPAPTHLSRPTQSSPVAFSMLTTQLEPDPFVGTLYLGRIHSGVISVGDNLIALNAEGEEVGSGKVKKIFSRVGMERIERTEAGAGEIVSIAGVKLTKTGAGINLTLAHPASHPGYSEGQGPIPLPTTPIDPPTISTFIYPNDGPFAGKEGSKVTSQFIRDRIYKEAETNVALKVLPGPTSESLELRGRGILHLGVLFEGMRREGYEFMIGPPKAVMIPDPDLKGTRGPNSNIGMLEPIESCTIHVREEYAGTVVQKLTMRKGEMSEYVAGDPEEGFVRIEMDVPARGLIGYMAGEFKNDVHGEGTLNHMFSTYAPYKGPIDTGRNGALISMANGESSAYAMAPLQARGIMFISPNTNVYRGMIIGECSKSADLYVNPCLKKQLTNIRAAGADEKIVISSPRSLTLEDFIAYMKDDELVEVTPKSVRLRKVVLDPDRRRRMVNSGKIG